MCSMFVEVNSKKNISIIQYSLIANNKTDHFRFKGFFSTTTTTLTSLTTNITDIHQMIITIQLSAIFFFWL